VQEALGADLMRLLPFRKGHFLLESGHHGDSWLDLELAAENQLPLERLVQLPNQIWDPRECPLCARHVPLTGQHSS
jgi:hypothetical protein